MIRCDSCLSMAGASSLTRRAPQRAFHLYNSESKLSIMLGYHILLCFSQHEKAILLCLAKIGEPVWRTVFLLTANLRNKKVRHKKYKIILKIKFSSNNNHSKNNNLCIFLLKIEIEREEKHEM